MIENIYQMRLQQILKAFCNVGMTMKDAKNYLKGINNENKIF